jgi:dTDP-glucose 4,6-dehydratase
MTKKTNVLCTGSCGFIFSNFMRKVMQENSDEYNFVSVDKVLAAYNYPNVLINQDHPFYMGDIADEVFMNNVFAMHRPDIVIHGAAESFVDDSIRSAGPFIHSNVVGTQVMVDLSLKYNVSKFIQVSTDEIYGQLQEGEKSWTEESPINPRNPYSASKASAELIVKAANQTHGLNYIITRCCNNFGPKQPPRNLIPKVITCSLNNIPIPIHGSGKQLREWIYVQDHCSAIITLIKSDVKNETYNIGTGFEKSNLEIVRTICNKLNLPENISFIKDRPGHDFRYSVDTSKIRSLGWEPKYSFSEGMDKCIDWYYRNRDFYT